MTRPLDDLTWREQEPVEVPEGQYRLEQKCQGNMADGAPCCVRRAFCPRLAEHMATILDSDVKPSGEFLWHQSRQAAESVVFSRPAHDQWQISSLVLVTCDDFMRRVYHTPYWHHPTLCKLTPIIFQVLQVEISSELPGA